MFAQLCAHHEPSATDDSLRILFWICTFFKTILYLHLLRIILQVAASGILKSNIVKIRLVKGDFSILTISYIPITLLFYTCFR